MKRLIILLAAFTLLSCAVGPDYKRPAVDIPQRFRFEDREAKDLANTTWWEQFNDPVLNDLIQIALQENKDVKVAAARIEQFVGQYVTTRARFFPQVGAGGSGGMARITERGLPPLQSGVDNHNDVWQVFLNGKLLLKTSEARTLDQDSDTARDITLNKGINVVVFKIFNEGGSDWQGCLRFTDAKDKAVTNLVVRLEP
jgi:multidrug efflux system outer membrane protein